MNFSTLDIYSVAIVSGAIGLRLIRRRIYRVRYQYDPYFRLGWIMVMSAVGLLWLVYKGA